MGALNRVHNVFVIFCLLLLSAVLTLVTATSHPASAATGINQQLNFQGRLFNAQGATVPDGYYNIQFKIYQDGTGTAVGNPSGTLKWTESHLNSSSQGVEVKNGFMSVQLGSVTAFGSSIDWNQDTLWLSMNIGSTNGSCTPFSSCTPDGEMVPMKRLSATPFAMNAQNANTLGGLTSAGFIQNASTPQTANFNINGNGTIGGMLSVGGTATTTAGGAAGIGTQSFTTNAYVQSRGMNLVTNGTGLLGNNYNFPAFTFDATQTFSGGGSFKNSTFSASTSSEEFIPVDPGKYYTQTLWAKATTFAAGAHAYFGVAEYDIDNNQITSSYTMRQAGTDTTLAAPLAPGDTTIQLTSAANWSNSAGASTWLRNILVYGHTNSRGYTYPDYTYTRRLVANAYADGGVNTSTNTITLSSPWPATWGTIAAGTAISNGSAGGSYKYISASNVVVPNTWTKYSGTIGGIDTSGTNRTSQFAPGVASIKMLFLMNRDVAGNTTNVSTLSFTEVSANNLTLFKPVGTYDDSTSYFQIQNATGSSVLSADTVNRRIAVGTAAPASYTLDVGGDINTTTQYRISGVTTLNNTSLTFSGASTSTISSAASQSLSANGATGITLQTAGITRATLDTANSLYLGNGVTAAAPNNFAIRGTGSTTTAVTGGALTIQGGNATVGNANGGNVTIAGGTGVGTGASGLVVLTTPTFSTTINDPNCYTGGALVATSCTIAASSVNNSAAILLGFNQLGKTATLPNPTITTAGRVVYLTAANGSSDFTVSVNGGGVGNLISMRQNTSATMIWNGSDWTAAGASSSTTLQSAYDNTLQTAGGAELIVSKTSTTNGLTIRDSSTNPVNGTLLTVQTSSAAGLFSVNSNVTEYSSSSGAETAGSGGANTFPASTWSTNGAATVTRYTTAGNYIATGQGSVSVATTTAAGDGVKNTLTTTLTPNTSYNVSFAARLASGTLTNMDVYYSIDGTATSVPCKTNQAVPTSVWTKVNCTFTAPASGLTASNAILIRQTGSGTARTFYVDNLSVTIAADYNYAADSSVSNAAAFTTNWTSVASSTVTRSTTVGNDASDSAQVVTTGTGQGVRNKLAISPLVGTLYRVTVYAASSTSGFNNFTVRYSRDGGTSFVSCADYNTQTVSSVLTDFTKITCYITTDATSATNPYLYITQTDTTGRTFYVDTLSMTLSASTTPNVQVGGGLNGGPVTLLTLDRGASAPIASNNDALLGSMYYDTTLGKLQCYEADGWGACGSSPDNVVTISPEYTNAVMHGTGVGTMVSDICSDALNIHDGSSSQATICGTNETYNFYKWTSPQASAQTYSIYVTYQLPATFKSFASGQTSIMGRTDSTNATVAYQVYRNDPTTGLTPCGSSVPVASNVSSSWQTGIATGAADPSTCGFVPGNSIVFKINATTSQNANAYIGNLNFTFSNK